jgi:hypothetical protein
LTLVATPDLLREVNVIGDAPPFIEITNLFVAELGNDDPTTGDQSYVGLARCATAPLLLITRHGTRLDRDANRPA